MPRPRRFLLLPGTGADGRIFPGGWDTLPGEVVRVDWRSCAGATTLEEAAAMLILRHDIGASDTLIGISLGGMVAAEIAARTRVDRVFLLGSALHPTEVSRFLAAIHPLIGLIPLRLVQRLARHIPRPECRMFADADPDFIRDMIFAIFRWPGQTRLSPPPIRLHGVADPVIPCPPDTRHRLPGGHMFMVSDPAACIARVCAEIDRRPSRCD